MPITLKSEKIKIKSENGDYVNISALAETSTQEYLDAIEAKGLNTINNIPNDYVELSNNVNLLKNGQLTGSSLTFSKGTANETTITASQLSALVSLASAEGVTF